MKKMKKLGLLTFFVCIIFRVSNVDGQCTTTNNDIINLLDQLDVLVSDYANLESVLNKCLIGADNIFSNGLTSLNNYLDSRGEVRVVDYLNFLARLPVDMVAYSDRYDALAAGNASLDSLDQLWLTYVQSIPKTLYDLNNYYKKIKKITGDSQKYAAVLDNVLTRFQLDQISLEYDGKNRIGQSSSLVADFRSFALIADQFCKEFARLLLDYQPKSYPNTVGFSLSERDMMFSYSYAVANYSKMPKLEARPFIPENASHALTKLYGFLDTMTYQYNEFYIGNLRLIPTFVSFLYLPFSYRSILFSASTIQDTFDDLGFNGNNLSNLSLASGILDSLFASLPDEYEDLLYNSVPIGASKNDIDNLSILLPDVDQVLKLLIPAVSAYQPASYNCIKGAFSSLNDVTFGIEILRKKFNVSGLDPINNAIDTIGNQLKVIKLIINDYNQVHLLDQLPSEMSFFMIKLLKLILKSWKYDIESKNYIFRQAPNYYNLYQALIGLDIDSINSEYNAIKSGSLNQAIPKSDLIKALEILMPNIESLQTELVEIYTRMQDERDVPLLTANAQKLLANYNSIKSELGLPNQTLIRGVFSVMTQKIRELYDECGNLQPRFQQPNETDLKNAEFLLYTLLTFGAELTAINQTYPLPVQQTIQAQSVSQGVQVLAATSSLTFNFDALAEVIQALSSQLTKLISIIEFVVSNPPQTRTVTRLETIFSDTPVFQIQTKTESRTKSETKTSTNLKTKTRTKWRTNKIQTTTTKERTKLKTKYFDNWLTRTITKDFTRRHIIKEPITIIETIHNRYENHGFKDKLTRTIEVEVVRTMTERREKIRTETMDKMRTETKWLTRTIREYWQDEEEKDNRQNYRNKKYQDREDRRREKNRKKNYDDDEEDAIERKIEQALKKKMFKLD